MRCGEIWKTNEIEYMSGEGPDRIRLIEYILNKDAYICVDATLESELPDEYGKTKRLGVLARKDILERYVRES